MRPKAALSGVAGGLIGIGALGESQIVNCGCGNLAVPRCQWLRDLKFAANGVRISEVRRGRLLGRTARGRCNGWCRPCKLGVSLPLHQIRYLSLSSDLSVFIRSVPFRCRSSCVAAARCRTFLLCQVNLERPSLAIDFNPRDPDTVNSLLHLLPRVLRVQHHRLCTPRIPQADAWP